MFRKYIGPNAQFYHDNFETPSERFLFPKKLSILYSIEEKSIQNKKLLK